MSHTDKRISHHHNPITPSGTTVGGNVTIDSGDFVGRDNVSHHQVHIEAVHVHPEHQASVRTSDRDITLVLGQDFYCYQPEEQERLLEAIRHLLLAGMGTVGIERVRQ